MRNKLKTIIALVFAVIVSVNALAYDFEKDGIYYNINSDSTVGVTYHHKSDSVYYSDYSGEVTIPSSVTYNGTTYSVTLIDSNAFRGCTGLTSITIPNSVEILGIGALRDCTGLKEVKMGSNVKVISHYAFWGCTNLLEISLGDNLDTIDYAAFYGCSSLKNISIPNSTTFIGEYVFGECTSLTTVIIPDNVKSIGNTAFYGCSALKEVKLGKSVTYLGRNAFHECASLTKINIPAGLTVIDTAMFYGCTSLETITIPNNIKVIKPGVFYKCENLQTVKIGNGVDTIDGGAFYGCKGLKAMWCMAELPPQLPAFEDDDSITYPTFNDVPASMNLYVACKRADAYSAADAWKNFNISEDCSITGFEAEEDTTSDSGIEDIAENNNISVYPNPASVSHTGISTVTIQGIDGDVTVFNNKGQVVYKSNIQSQKSNIDISGWQSGVYYIKVGDATKKLIIK
ncbi:MAG: leucine-rich repeat protein [Bacteroidales bacterium]|nr:leucine-rich repeat protein [Bacteroidales bacterium]